MSAIKRPVTVKALDHLFDDSRYRKGLAEDKNRRHHRKQQYLFSHCHDQVDCQTAPSGLVTRTTHTSLTGCKSDHRLMCVATWADVWGRIVRRVRPCVLFSNQSISINNREDTYFIQIDVMLIYVIYIHTGWTNSMS